jgi:hypothetical protein
MYPPMTRAAALVVSVVLGVVLYAGWHGGTPRQAAAPAPLAVSATPRQSAPAPLPVAASWAGGALTVAWPTVPGAQTSCVYRLAPDALLGCVASPPYVRGPAGWDTGATVRQGDTVEVRVTGTEGEDLAAGRASVFGAARWLPMIAPWRP